MCYSIEKFKFPLRNHNSDTPGLNNTVFFPSNIIPIHSFIRVYCPVINTTYVHLYTRLKTPQMSKYDSLCVAVSPLANEGGGFIYQVLEASLSRLTEDFPALSQEYHSLTGQKWIIAPWCGPHHTGTGLGGTLDKKDSWLEWLGISWGFWPTSLEVRKRFLFFFWGIQLVVKGF